MEHVWLVTGVYISPHEGVFKTRKSARLYIKTKMERDSCARQWYTLAKAKVKA